MSQPTAEGKLNSSENILPEKLDDIFGDLEARGRLVGFYDLAYKVDRRVNPHLYKDHD